MNEINNNTQINDKEVNKIKYQIFEDKYMVKEYKGKMVEMTLADFQIMYNWEKKYNALIEEYDKQKKELRQCKQAIKNLQDKANLYVEQSKQKEMGWKNALDAANRKLAVFTDNQRGGKIKFTPEMQKCVLQVISKGGSITMAHNAVMKEFNSPDISYETVRRYVAEIRLKSR